MEKIILGIDPGLRITGFSVLKLTCGQPTALDIGYLQLGNIKEISDRLIEFEKFLMHKIMEHKISDLCIETPFLGKNAQTFLKLGFLRGILLLTAKKQNLILHEFAPTTVKQAVTGSGRADKEQVARAVFSLFTQLKSFNKTTVLDVTDALAVGLCGVFSLDALAKNAQLKL